MPVERKGGGGGRNYRREYLLYQGKPEQKKRRAQRNAARRKMMKAGKVRKGDGKEVDHKNFNTADNSMSNLQVMSEHDNAKKNRGRGGRPKGGRKKI
jgi:hypothetical protein